MTRCQRNLLGQIEAVTDALGNTERYTYDAKGLLIEKLDREGYLTKYGYTAQGGVNRIAYADGRALKVQYPDGKEVSYSYGKSRERIGIIYPNGEKTVYTYDSALRLSGLSDRNGTITYGYDRAGLLARKTFPNGMETSYAYDMEGRLAELTHRDREGILDRYSYQYDLMGNRTVIEKQRRRQGDDIYLQRPEPASEPVGRSE